MIAGRELTAAECLQLLRAYGIPALTLSGGFFHLTVSQQLAHSKALRLGYDGIEITSAEINDSYERWLALTPSATLTALSIHLPLSDDPERLAAWAQSLPLNRFVLHPERPEILPLFRPLGSRLLIENMDGSRGSWRTPDELEEVFEELPEAGVCLDLAHVELIDPSLSLAEEFFARYSERIRQLHLSRLASDYWHLPLTDQALARFAPLLEQAKSIPWVIEAPFADGPCDPARCARCRRSRE